mgnify:CR=1 FL=1
MTIKSLLSEGTPSIKAREWRQMKTTAFSDRIHTVGMCLLSLWVGAGLCYSLEQLYNV